MDEEANLAEAYRQARRDFIAACRKAGADTIARVHPKSGPDRKPLFCDSAAFGPRNANRGLLLIAGQDGVLLRLLEKGFTLPKTARLVLVHALDPFASAWGRPGKPRDWPQKTLAAIATEELLRVTELVVLGDEGEFLRPALASALPKASIVIRDRPAAEAEILAAIAGL
jgi:hypothetical protein